MGTRFRGRKKADHHRDAKPEPEQPFFYTQLGQHQDQHERAQKDAKGPISLAKDEPLGLADRHTEEEKDDRRHKHPPVVSHALSIG